MNTSERTGPLLPVGAVVLGPMAGITEAPFRAICKRMGAALTFTEMVSAKGLHYNPDSPISNSLLTLDPHETPAVVQLFGSEPEIMARQAARVAERHGTDIAAIDINMGCPVTKVVSKGEGSALMRTPELAEKIVASIVAACDVPVTAKFRKGWDSSEVNAVEFARRMEAAGASAVTVHGRTRSQFYHGTADWQVIAEVKRSVSIPVIGSGDVFSARDAMAMFDGTGVDAVMIARGAQGNPWIFRECRSLIDAGVEAEAPSWSERLDMAREHAEGLMAFGGEHAFRRMRKHVAWYVHGMPNASTVRDRVMRVSSFTELDALLCEYRAELETLADSVK